jgi:TonB family protein
MSLTLAFLLSACLIRNESCFTAADDVTVWQSVRYAHPAAYPELPRRARVTGTVVVAVEVLPSGEVSSSTLIGAGLPMGLSQASLEAAKKWVFEPSDRGYRRELDFEFSLAEGCDPAPPPVERLGAYRLRTWRQNPRLPSYVMSLRADGQAVCTTVLKPCPPD